MIEWMQKHKKYLVVTIWVSGIAFVLAGFLGWGSYNFSNLISTKIAKVGNIYITAKDLQTKLVATTMLLGQRLSDDDIKKLGLEKKIMNDLIIEALMLNYAKDLGLSASDDEIAQHIINNPSFSKNNKFDMNLYVKMVNSIGLNTQEYENNLKKSIIINKLQQAIKLAPRKIDIDMLASKNFMQDKLSIKVLTANDINVSINNDDLLKYYDAHKNEYKSKKSYDIETFLVSADDIKLSNDELQKFYEENKIKYKDKNDKILDFNSSIDLVKRDLEEKKEKSSALSKYALLKKGEINFNNKLTIDDKNETFVQLGKNSEKDKILKPFKYGDDFLIIKIDKINEPEVLEFENAKELVIKDYKNSVAQKKLKELANEELKKFNGTDIGFVSRDTNTTLIKELNDDEFSLFVNQIFDKEFLKGYVPIDDKVVVYEVTAQKLNNPDEFKKNYDYLENASSEIINAILNQDLIAQLQKIYKIEFYKGKNIE